MEPVLVSSPFNCLLWTTSPFSPTLSLGRARKGKASAVERVRSRWRDTDIRQGEKLKRRNEAIT